MLAAQSKDSRMVGGSTDKDESEVAVIPNQSAPRWKVTTLTARGNCRNDFERGALSHRKTPWAIAIN
jgi:hypothetical protein